MPMDATDTKLLKGAILFVLLGVVVYFYPFAWPMPGVQAQLAKEAEARKALNDCRTPLEAHYDPLPPAVWGEDPDAPRAPVIPGRVPLADRNANYKRAIADEKKQIKAKQAASRFNFEAAGWTTLPTTEPPGNHFIRTFDRVRRGLETDWMREAIMVDDRDIGFEKFKGDLNRPPEVFRELLQELFIAETVIRLCIKAKRETEEEENRKDVTREAFMRIISVEPEKSTKVGPYALKLNPRYDERVMDPKDERFEKYIPDPDRKWPEFVQMFPVRIELLCDVHSFMRFLHAVRSKGQFLVIRNLRIISPFAQDSLRDPHLPASLASKGKDLQENHIWVSLSAAGMDFFEPSPAAPQPKKASAADKKRDAPSAPGGI